MSYIVEQAKWSGFSLKSAALIAAIIAAPCLADAGGLTVDEAYRAIPHVRTVFEARLSTLPNDRSLALNQLFTLTDRGVVLRVEGLRALQLGDTDKLHQLLTGYADLLDELSALSIPEQVKPARDLAMVAIGLHQRYFENQLSALRSSDRIDRAFGQVKEVTLASRRLHTAYNFLISSFPGESAANRKAFFDHLCALDFL